KIKLVRGHMDVKGYIYAASAIFILVIGLTTFGRFLWKAPSLLDSAMMKEVGKFVYRILCKSGFIVIVIIIITYYICINSPAITHHEKVKYVSDAVTNKKGSDHE
ncbi:hypothetical protein, partial [Cronobacter malonaticus]|uniref:hypothetical protein n=1 Tax=Cronobacter malonaticus TaxID=413503 RepID=UPI001F303BA5